MRKSIDIETALAAGLRADGYSASAHMTPKSLGESLPHIRVVRTGGEERDMVIEVQRVDVDVYAADAAASMEAACDLCGYFRDLAGGICYTSEITTLPYSNPDPRHLDLSRTTFKVEMTTRVVEE